MLLAILAALAWPAVHAFTLFMYFLAFLTVYRAHLNGNLAKAAPVVRWACWSVVAIGWALDVAFNWVLGTIALREWPQELTLTKRCSRHMRNPDWRGRLCRWVCDQLDLFQDGGHCR